MGLKKYLLISIIGSVALIILPDYVTSSFAELKDIINVVGYVLLILSSIFTGVLFYKQFVASRVRQKADASDAMWDDDNLKRCARGAFYKIQNAWEKDDTTLLKDVATPEFLADTEHRLKRQNFNEKGVQIDSINITETNVICCRDYLNNDKDRFATYLKGALTGYSLTGDRSLIEDEFSEIYHFVRSGNDWLLNKITGHAMIIDLIFLESFIQAEKPG